MPKKLESLLSSIMSSESVKSREQAIRIAKAKGFIRQKGGHLAMTAKGRKTDA
jgi:hypothetical protein